MDDVTQGRRGTPWDRVEIEAAVSAYVGMLQRELRGAPYVKRQVVAELQPWLRDRTTASIERKMQNISAVLDEVGLDWVEGYKPLTHYQRELRDVVLGRLASGDRIAESMAAYEDSALAAPSRAPLATDDVVVPPPSSRPGRADRSSVGLTGSAMSAMRDFKKRQLGEAGESWVLELEREGLARQGRRDLADAVRWIAVEDGDGAGYDIRSFRPDGSDRLIEVKTTNLGPRTPFYITRWEIEMSREHAAMYSLYRVHGFARDPRIYILDGNIEETAKLDPKVFLGIPL